MSKAYSSSPTTAGGFYLEADEQDWACLAAVSGAMGIRGAVRLKPFTEDPRAVGDYGPVTVFSKQAPEGHQYGITLLHNIKGGVAAQLAGMETRDDAEAMKGARLYVSRDALPGLEDDAYYHSDLMGLTVKDEEGVAFGTVKAVHNFGAGDLVEVVLDGLGKSVMVRFTEDTVPVVNIEEGLMVINRSEIGEDL